MKLLVCGTRKWTDYQYLSDTLDDIHKDTPVTEVIEGNAKGADQMAGLWANHKRIQLMVVPANWAKYGRAAGPIRNQEMVDMGPDLVVAFVKGPSVGTEHTIRFAKKAGIPVKVISDV